jgi:hypothetical protein
MKLSLIICCLVLSACAQTGQRKSDAVVPMNRSEHSYLTQCNGMFDKWDSCVKRANLTCPNGFAVIDHMERPGNVREFMFKCM